MRSDETKSDEKLSPNGEELITLWQLENVITSLSGRILTIIEAAMVDKGQRDAVKSLIKKELWGTYNSVSDWYFQQDPDGKNRSMFPLRGNVEE